MKQITFDEANGKTFRRIVKSKYDEQLLVIFDDNTFCVVKIEQYGESISTVELDAKTSIEEIIDSYNESVIVAVGLTTKDQLVELKATRDARYKKKLEERERQTLKQLQEKYSTAPAQVENSCKSDSDD